MPSNASTTFITAVALGAGLVLGPEVFGEDKSPVLILPADSAVASPTKSKIKAVKESCSSLVSPSDNDWDGAANENWPLLGQSCDGPDEDAFPCGQFVCNAEGTGVVCSETEVPRLEWCDGLDNDCDGQIDEGFKVGNGCRVGVGACQRKGKIVCADDKQSSVCDAIPGEPGIETCDDNKDNDCDGLPDGCDDDCPGAPCPIWRIIR